MPESQRRKQSKSHERIFRCVCVGLDSVLHACHIHVCSLFYEKLANVQSTPIRRLVQRGCYPKSTRIKTLQHRTSIKNERLRVCCVGPGVVPIIALIRARGVCNKMQQNKIEVGVVGGCHNVGLVSDEDGCCCLQSKGKHYQDVKGNTFHCAARLCD